MRPILRVLAVRHTAGYRLHLTFSDGSEGEADMTDHLTDVLSPLRNKTIFESVSLRDGAVEWPGDFDVGAEFLHALTHNLPVPITGEDVDANLAAVRASLIQP